MRGGLGLLFQLIVAGQILNGTAIKSAVFHFGRADVQITLDPVFVQLVRPSGNAPARVRHWEGIDGPDDRWRWTARGRAVQVNGPAGIDHLLVEDVRQSRWEVTDDQFGAGLTSAAGQLARLHPHETLIHPRIGQQGLVDPHNIRLREVEPSATHRNVQSIPGPAHRRPLSGSQSGHVASQLHRLINANNLK